MIIKKNTEMLLFRFNNYKSNNFIAEHNAVLEREGFVWMLKIGKRSSIEKLDIIIEQGGWLILRSPKADGSKSFLAHFSEYAENEPKEKCFPLYYREILNSISDEDTLYSSEPSYQWFKLDYLTPLDKHSAAEIVVSKSEKKVDSVVNTTRTAVMFVKNAIPIEVK